MDTIVWNIIQFQHRSEELWPGQGFWVCVHYDLDHEDMTSSQCHHSPLGHGQYLDLDLEEMALVQGHDTILGYEQYLCEILSRSNMAVRSYGPDTDFEYVCTAILTLDIWP